MSVLELIAKFKKHVALKLGSMKVPDGHTITWEGGDLTVGTKVVIEDSNGTIVEIADGETLTITSDDGTQFIIASDYTVKEIIAATPPAGEQTFSDDQIKTIVKEVIDVLKNEVSSQNHAFQKETESKFAAYEAKVKQLEALEKTIQTKFSEAQKMLHEIADKITAGKTPEPPHKKRLVIKDEDTSDTLIAFSKVFKKDNKN